MFLIKSSVGLSSPHFRWWICCTSHINSKNTRWP